jgi:hypothetical protein
MRCARLALGAERRQWPQICMANLRLACFDIDLAQLDTHEVQGAAAGARRG